MMRLIYGITTAAVTISTFGFIAYDETRYTRSAVCIASYNGEHTFEDRTGNLWGWDTTDKIYEIGKEYILEMSDNHTPMNIKDDPILKVRG